MLKHDIEKQEIGEEHHDLFEHLNEAAFLIDSRTGLVAYANARAEMLLGRHRSRIIGKHNRQIYPLDKADEYEKRFYKQREQLGFLYAEVVKEDGTTVPVAITASDITTNGSNLTLGLFRDITDLRLVEEALRESEDRFRRLSDASFEGIAIHEKGIILDANQALASLIKHDLSEIIGARLEKFVEPEFHDLFSHNARSGLERPYEVVCIRKDGTKFRAEFSTKRLHYREREAGVTAVRDITERILMEDKLRTIFESISDGVILCNLDGKILEVNDAELRLHGFSSKQDLLGRNFLELIVKQDHNRAKRNFINRLEDRRKYNSEYSFLRRDGTEFDAEVSVAVLKEESLRPTGFIAVTRDITERNRLRKNMQYYITEIIKAQEEERRRVARELHDETVQSLVYLGRSIDTILRSKETLPKRTAQQLEQLREQASNTMSEVRRFSQELRPDILDRMGLIPALESMIDDINKEGLIKGRMDIAKYERRTSPEAELVMFRIAQEAVRNVCRHSQATMVSILVEFTESEASITINDNGIGFEVPEILGDFAHKGKLGLIGMKERVRLLDGAFSVDSQLGKGTRITAKVKLS